MKVKRKGERREGRITGQACGKEGVGWLGDIWRHWSNLQYKDWPQGGAETGLSGALLLTVGGVFYHGGWGGEEHISVQNNSPFFLDSWVESDLLWQTIYFSVLDWLFFNQTVLNKDIQSSQWHSYILKIQLPDDSVPLTVCNVGVVCEQNGVVGHHWLTGGQNASCHIAYTVQNAVIHQEVVHQQLYTHRQTDIQIATGGPNVAQQWLHSSQETDTLTPNSFTPLCGVFE